MSIRGVKIVAVCAIVLLIVFAYWFLSAAELWDFFRPTEIEDAVKRFGPWGPVLIVGMMVVAVVFSPIPSAPIALAAGAAYGHFWGAAYVLAGAELGALIAFGLARFLGHDLIRAWLGDRLDAGRLGSQNALMATVFVTRLLPFVSFDLVSYAAGLTALTFWRFAAATLAGIVPASFLLAHFGGELVTADARRISIAVLALGAFTALPLLFRSLQKKRAQRCRGHSSFSKGRATPTAREHPCRDRE